MPVKPVRRTSKKTGRPYIAGYRIGRGRAVYPTKETALRVQRAIKSGRKRQP